MPTDPTTAVSDSHHEPIVSVFDTRAMAQRAVAELTAADFDDIWLGVVRGETDDGETLVRRDDAHDDEPLHRVLAQRGSGAAVVHRFDGILPPGTAVMSLRVRTKFEHAVDIIEMVGGHIDHL